MPGDDKFNLSTIADVKVNLSVEAGTKNIRLGDVKSLSCGSVVELDKAVGDLLNIKVNGKTIAKGEVVVVNDSLGVRIVELLSTSERLKS